MVIAKRGKYWYVRFRPFGDQSIGIKTRVATKTEAKHIEMSILIACRSGDYRALDPISREVCVRMFTNQGWEIPPDLAGDEPKQELTLWKAAELFLKYPEIKDAPGRWRHENSLVHLVEKLGQHRPIKSIWVPELKTYQIERLNEGAAPATINLETSTLSKLFTILAELRLVKSNPVRMLKRLSVKSGERQVYLSFDDFNRIIETCPLWFQRLAKTAYFTGMRRGELTGLTRNQVNLAERMIVLSPENTKEIHWKRIPIHKDLLPVLEAAMKVTALDCDKVFLVQDRMGVRPLGKESNKNPWPRACKKLGLEKPWPRFHDLRHTWKTNARRSGMDPEIRESILGHWFKEKTVVERYGRISNEELIKAIDSMTFDHGNTEILVAGK